MDAKTLRASILQMAIEGKLVPQLDEEPAVEQLGDAPEEVPFEIPGKWKWCRLKHLGMLVTGNTPSTSNRCYYGHDIPFIKPDAIGYDSCVRYKKEGLSNVGRAVAKIVPPKSLLMVCIGGSIGKVAIVNNEVAFNQQINAICCNSSVVSVEYLLSVMSSSYFQNTVRANATGTATPIINKSKWGNIFIPIPPLTLQHRIVARLNELLSLVDKFGKAQEALAIAQKEFLEKLKASLLQEAIQGKLVPQLDEEPAVEQIGEAPEDVPFAIPEKWKWVLLRHITQRIHYGFTASATLSGDYRLLRITDLKSSGVSWETVPYCTISDEEALKFSLKKNDIVIARTGGTIGKSFLIKNIDGKSVFASYLIRAIPETGLVDPGFLINFLSSPLYWSQLKEVSRGTGQPNVNAKSLGTLMVPLPPLEEQRRIVARLNELFPLVTQMATATVK